MDSHDDINSGQNWTEAQFSLMLVIFLFVTKLTTMLSMFTTVTFTVMSLFLALVTMVAISSSELLFIFIFGFIPEFVGKHPVSFSSSIPFFVFTHGIDHEVLIFKREVLIYSIFFLHIEWNLIILVLELLGGPVDLLIARVLIHKVIYQVLDFGIFHATDVDVQVDLLTVHHRLVV